MHCKGSPYLINTTEDPFVRAMLLDEHGLGVHLAILGYLIRKSDVLVEHFWLYTLHAFVDVVLDEVDGRHDASNVDSFVDRRKGLGFGQMAWMLLESQFI